MKLNKYYVTASGWKGARQSIFYNSKIFTDKKKAIHDFAMQQVKCLELNFPFTEYDEVWICLHYRDKALIETIFSSMFDINVLKAYYKKGRRCDIID